MNICGVFDKKMYIGWVWDTTVLDTTAEVGTVDFSRKDGQYGGVTWHSHNYGHSGATRHFSYDYKPVLPIVRIVLRIGYN